MKTLLLDTHTLLWFYEGDAQLPPGVRNAILEPVNRCYVSVASLWEITIKYHLGKLHLDDSLEELFRFVRRNQFLILPVEFEHLLTLNALHDHHKDPFDRLIIAQAITEGLVVSTKDSLFEPYGIMMFWE